MDSTLRSMYSTYITTDTNLLGAGQGGKGGKEMGIVSCQKVGQMVIIFVSFFRTHLDGGGDFIFIFGGRRCSLTLRSGGGGLVEAKDNSVSCQRIELMTR